MRSIFIFALLMFSHASLANTEARIITDVGTITIRFLESSAPKTVENFVKLASGEQKYIDIKGQKSMKPFYNGLKFHRVHPDLGIFSGCPWGTGRGWPGYYMFDEAPTTSNFDAPGLVAMAKVPGDNRVGSQFFITSKPEPRWNGKYTIFAKVTSGMDVVNKIANLPHDTGLQPLETVTIRKIEIVKQQASSGL
ncbi:MAG: peptidylprolyl isomerase [Bdellovibrionaceae bacterium]|nr:peptidylprolyl isomerase [Pseudobdellovibrionaceae bacterium]